MEKVRVGVVGCGNISETYLRNSRIFSSFEIVACSDKIPERASSRAKEFQIPALSVKELLSDPRIELVLNLTTPDAHYTVARDTLKAGKSVYNEKPLAINLREGEELLKMAEMEQALIGGAPDTFMGGGIQTCRKLIDDCWIGEPVAATAFMTSHGPEDWHPDPGFLYKVGAGPMFDMGPYYLTALVNLIGPIKSVKASARITFPERLVTSEPKRGAWIRVETPTHVAGVIDFHCGAVGTIITSFDVWGSQLPHVEVYGSQGSLSVPDPNTFGGPVKILRQGEEGWSVMPLTHGYVLDRRGLGVADMAYALRSRAR